MYFSATVLIRQNTHDKISVAIVRIRVYTSDIVVGAGIIYITWNR